jgi:hypothetical protein
MAIRISNKKIIDALKATNGAIYLAARKLGIAPNTIYNHMEKSPEIRAIVEDSRGETVDIAEQKLRAAILNGEPWAIALELKTIGKSRGYVEKQEIDTAGTVEIIVKHSDRAEPTHIAPETEGDISILGETEDIS